MGVLRIIGPCFHSDSAFWPDCLFENRENSVNPLLRRIWGDFQIHGGDLGRAGVVVAPSPKDTRKGLRTRSVPALHSSRIHCSVTGDPDLQGTRVGQQSDSGRGYEHARTIARFRCFPFVVGVWPPMRKLRSPGIRSHDLGDHGVSQNQRQNPEAFLRLVICSI